MFQLLNVLDIKIVLFSSNPLASFNDVLLTNYKPIKKYNLNYKIQFLRKFLSVRKLATKAMKNLIHEKKKLNI